MSNPNTRHASLAVVVCGLAALFLAGCGKSDKPAEQEAPPPKTFTDQEYVQAFHRGVSELEQHRFVEAAQTFDELTRSRPKLVAPWINLASAQLNRAVNASFPACLAACEQAIALDPKAPQPYFIRGVLYKHLGQFPEAEQNFRKALEYAPDDPAALYNLSSLVADRDLDEAMSLLEKALEGETHLSSAYYSLMGLKRRADKGGYEEFLNVFRAFENANTGNKMKIVYTEMGRLGEAVRDLPIAVESRPSSRETPKIGFDDPVSKPGIALAAITLDDKAAIVCREDDGKLAAYQWSAKGLERAPREVFRGISASQRVSIAPGDWDLDGREDLAVADDHGVRLLTFDGKAFNQVGGNPLGANYRAWGCLWSDLDQDGDLDLVLWGPEGVTILVNRRDGKFERFDPAAPATRPGFRPPPLPATKTAIYQMCATDLDGDGDPDLLMGTDDGLHLWRNDRLMRFKDVTARAGFPTGGMLGRFVVADVDGDRAFDIVTNAAPDRMIVLRQSTKGPFRLTFTKSEILADDSLPLMVEDLDNDGRDELVTQSTQRHGLGIFSIEALLAGTKDATDVPLPRGPFTTFLVDLNGDLVLDLVASGDFGTQVRLGKKDARNHALEVRLQGRIFANTMHANTGGIGARVEVMAGTRSHLREVRSTNGKPGNGPLTLHFGLGPNTNADYVRIVWPDDVLQSEGWVPGDQVKVVEEFQRKASSCPILFAWNGERFECVTDFLGVGGLGFLLEPGVYGAPDPTEQVLIPRLEPKDGKLEIRIHEPFEEITYLDAARLVVVDHPADVDVVPDERFSVNAPQPDGKLLAIGKRMDPVAARDGRNRDVLKDVLASDRRQAHAVADPRFLGYAEPTTFEFDFGAPLAGHGGKDDVCLALDGWVEYPYSHINLAAFQAGVRLEALSVDVEVAGKGFVRVQNEAGYPAGMPRIMTLPLGKLPGGMTGKVRVLTNQELWIDRLFLFVPAPVRIESRTLQASSAELRTSGYPREYSPDGGAPRLYDYDIRDPAFPWKTMAGAYTAFGDVAPLLREADDCYVVFGGGEEVVLRFDPLPPPAAGMKRTYILDSFGWCKDMDCCTAFPYTVEPLPFRGMSNYPYAATESFPDSEEQRQWRAKYQTRILPGTRAR